MGESVRTLSFREHSRGSHQQTEIASYSPTSSFSPVEAKGVRALVEAKCLRYGHPMSEVTLLRSKMLSFGAILTISYTQHDRSMLLSCCALESYQEAFRCEYPYSLP